MTRLPPNKQRILQAYLWILGIFVLFWWPLSHWLYPEWYHRLMGFEDFDSSLVTIIGTAGLVPVMNIVFAAVDPFRNRAMLAILITFGIAMAGTYFFLIQAQGFPRREYFNMTLLIVNAVILVFLFPRGEHDPADGSSAGRPNLHRTGLAQATARMEGNEG